MGTLGSAFTETNGKGSSSRILMALMYGAVTSAIVHHAWITGQWPDGGTLAALAVFCASPYGINQGSKLATAVAGKPENVAATAAADTTQQAQTIQAANGGK